MDSKPIDLRVPLLVLFLMSLFVSACGSEIPAIQEVSTVSLADSTSTITPAEPHSTALPSQPDTPTATASPTQTPTFTPSLTPSQTPPLTPTWVYNQAGEVIAPILLYHHIDDEVPDSRYYVTVENFRAQMEALSRWGYTTIPLSRLLDALIDGAELPPRPIVISFDDGHISVYENAFPIMQEFGFVGLFYIVSNRLEAAGFVNADQLTEMIEAGWEVGSHSQSHADLVGNHSLARNEILQSRLDLEDALGVKINTFAYPFGTVDWYVAKKVQDYGYRAAVGLGKSWRHTWNNIYYLERIEVQGGYTLDDLAVRLPWSGAPEE